MLSRLVIAFFPRVVLVVKKQPANTGDARHVGSIPGSGRSPGEGNGCPLQYSCLENPMDRGAWRATVLGVAELDRTEGLTLLFSSFSSEMVLGLSHCPPLYP